MRIERRVERDVSVSALSVPAGSAGLGEIAVVSIVLGPPDEAGHAGGRCLEGPRRRGLRGEGWGTAPVCQTSTSSHQRALKEENGTVVSTHDTQAEPESAGKDWLGANGGGEVFTHR